MEMRLFYLVKDKGVKKYRTGTVLSMKQVVQIFKVGKLVRILVKIYQIRNNYLLQRHLNQDRK